MITRRWSAKTPLVPAQAYALTQPSYASVAATPQNDEDWPDHVYDEYYMFGNGQTEDPEGHQEYISWMKGCRPSKAKGKGARATNR